MRLQLPNIVGLTLTAGGILALATSIIFSNSILAFIGLGLTFWGCLFLLLKPEPYTKATLLDSTTTPALKTLHQLLTTLHYNGKGVYLPPKYLTDLKSGLVYIPQKTGITIPPLGENPKDTAVSTNPDGLYITPPGLDLTNLFEKRLGTDFIRTDLQYLQDNLPNLFIEHLEIAQALEIAAENNLINVKITDSVYNNLHTQTQQLATIHNSIGCPLCSALACTLTRVTGNPIIIENSHYSPNDKTITVQYRILEE